MVSTVFVILKQINMLCSTANTSVIAVYCCLVSL